MALKNIENGFLQPTLKLIRINMEKAPFKEVSRRLDFHFPMFVEEALFDSFIFFPGEGDVPDSTLAIRWNDILTEVAALRINGNYLVPQTFTFNVEGPAGKRVDGTADVYIFDDDYGKPYMVITTEKTAIDFLNGTVQ